MKKINSYIKIVTAVGIIASLGACKKQLDLKPYDQIDATQAILTEADVQSTLIGTYSRAGLSSVYGGDIFLMPDLAGSQQEVDWAGTYQDLTQIVSQQIPANNGYINSLWLGAYRINNQANYVLANISKVTDANKNSVEGQAKFLRGMIYFDMARLFGKDWSDGSPTTNLAVPIVLTPTSEVNDQSYPARSTVAQVYAQAISDLKSAKSKLGSGVSFYANKYAAGAILARLYLQQGDWSNAAKEADTVIRSGKYSLVSNYADEFPFPNGSAVHVDNTTEDIFAMQVTSQQGINDLNTFYGSADYGGRGDIYLKESFLDKYEADDQRLAVYQEDSDGSLRVDKFDNLYGNVRVVRLAEMYLIRAEANLHLTTKVGTVTPLQDVNTIRSRAGATPLTAVTLDDVYNERVLELAFEGGFFLHDARRLKQNVGGLPWNSPKLVFPIPTLELNANKNLVQNEGY